MLTFLVQHQSQNMLGILRFVRSPEPGGLPLYWWWDQNVIHPAHSRLSEYNMMGQTLLVRVKLGVMTSFRWSSKGTSNFQATCCQVAVPYGVKVCGQVVDPPAGESACGHWEFIEVSWSWPFSHILLTHSKVSDSLRRKLCPLIFLESHHHSAAVSCKRMSTFLGVPLSGLLTFLRYDLFPCFHIFAPPLPAAPLTWCDSPGPFTPPPSTYQSFTTVCSLLCSKTTLASPHPCSRSHQGQRLYRLQSGGHCACARDNAQWFLLVVNPVHSTMSYIFWCANGITTKFLPDLY